MSSFTAPEVDLSAFNANSKRLIEHILNDNTVALKSILRTGNVNPHYTVLQGTSILEMAVRHGDVEVLRCLLRESKTFHCCAVAQCDKLFLAAVMLNHMEIIEYLVNFTAADINCSFRGQRPMRVAFDNRYTGLVRYFKNHVSFKVDQYLKLPTGSLHSTTRQTKWRKIHRPCHAEWCSRRGRRGCGKCRSVFYCSETCQKTSWLQEGHRVSCESPMLQPEPITYKRYFGSGLESESESKLAHCD